MCVAGLLRRVWYLFLQPLIILCYLILITDADLADDQFKGPILSPSTVPLAAPAIPDLPLPSNLPLLNKPRKKQFSPHGAPTFVVAPTQPPNYGPLITSGHPPTSSHLSKPSMKKNALLPPSAGLVDVSPTQSGDGTNPTGLAQSPLSPAVSGKAYCVNTFLFSFPVFMVHMLETQPNH